MGAGSRMRIARSSIFLGSIFSEPWHGNLLPENYLFSRVLGDAVARPHGCTSVPGSFFSLRARLVARLVRRVCLLPARLVDILRRRRGVLPPTPYPLRDGHGPAHVANAKAIGNRR